MILIWAWKICFSLYVLILTCVLFLWIMCVFSPLVFKSKINIPFLISFQIEMSINIDKSLKNLTSHVKLVLWHKQKLWRLRFYHNKEKNLKSHVKFMTWCKLKLWHLKFHHNEALEKKITLINVKNPHCAWNLCCDRN